MVYTRCTRFPSRAPISSGSLERAIVTTELLLVSPFLAFCLLGAGERVWGQASDFSLRTSSRTGASFALSIPVATAKSDSRVELQGGGKRQHHLDESHAERWRARTEASRLPRPSLRGTAGQSVDVFLKSAGHGQ